MTGRNLLTLFRRRRLLNRVPIYRKSAGVWLLPKKRAGELEKLICKIYEDNALGKLPDARYRALDAQYAKRAGRT